MFLNQFTTHSATDPITVVLIKEGQSWEEQIADKNRDEMNARFESIDATSHKPKDETYLKKWKDRTHGRKEKPRYKEMYRARGPISIFPSS